MVPVAHHKQQRLNYGVSRALVATVKDGVSDSKTHTNLINLPDLSAPTVGDAIRSLGTSTCGTHPCDSYLMHAARMFLPSSDGLNLRTMGEL